MGAPVRKASDQHRRYADANGVLFRFRQRQADRDKVAGRLRVNREQGGKRQMRGDIAQAYLNADQGRQ
ncbi:Uncharacterised protein [Salmonella enterica subsp. enterica]|uniref:Uncharacterized protein n=1 Tax=Salmonella enterica I TaxID=59201 RepID=A0A379VMP8_SALET|nr:Uncharacterised protein [Salmonella enterica subsp. enterica]